MRSINNIKSMRKQQAHVTITSRAHVIGKQEKSRWPLLFARQFALKKLVFKSESDIESNYIIKMTKSNHTL